MLSTEAKAKLEIYFGELPEKLTLPTATDQELTEFEARYETIPEDYRWFLKTCGGGVVGSEQFDGIAQLNLSHVKFRSESGLPRGWKMRDVFIIGWDGSGNPFGIERGSGRIKVENHQFGGIHDLAPSFEQFVLKLIS